MVTGGTSLLHVAKQQPAGSQAFTKTQYDGAGRQGKTFVGYDTSETSYANAGQISPGYAAPWAAPGCR